MESQNKEIRKHLESGNSLTPLDALSLFGCFRLGARIHDLKHKFGLNIKTEIVVIYKKQNFIDKYIKRKPKVIIKRFAKYSLIL